MTQATQLAIQMFLLTATFAILWGLSFVADVQEWIVVERQPGRSRVAVVRAFRNLVKSWCLFILPAALVLRSGLVLLGIGDAVIGQIIFFALAGSNLVGGLFAIISLRYD